MSYSYQGSHTGVLNSVRLVYGSMIGMISIMLHRSQNHYGTSHQIPNQFSQDEQILFQA